MISAVDYDKLERLNWSRLKQIQRSPMHFKESIGDDSGSFELGTACHMAILEPQKFEDTYVVYPGPVRRGKVWEAFETEQTRAGKEILNKTEYGKALSVREAVRRNPEAQRLLSGPGANEIAGVWNLEGEGFKFECKGRLDRIMQGAVIDLKSTACAAPKEFARSAAKYGYFGQAAWYFDGARLDPSLQKYQPREFYFIAVETSAPYLTQVYRVPESELEKGRALYSRLLGTLDFCQKNNKWHGYSEEAVMDLIAPDWMEEE